MPIDSSLVASRVDEVLGGMFASVMKLKARGVGMPQSRLRASERAFLTQSLTHLSEWLVEDPWNSALERAASAIRSKSRGAKSDDQNQWRLLGQRTGLDKLLSSEKDGEAAKYLLAQGLALDARHWHGHLDALFFAACQLAVHEAVRSVFGRIEVAYTEAFLRVLTKTVRESVVDPLRGLGPGLPEDLHLQFATASMQEGNDLQGADLAIVVGTLLYGKPMWRVVLLQAKSEKSQGKSEIGYKEGAQLAEILSTGMGAYLFYPKAKYEKIFVPTVRLAEHVFADAYKGLNDPEFGEIDPCGADGSAWDFASFVALEMRRPRVFGPGRVFPTVEAVADALSLGRERPLEPARSQPKGLVVASASPALDVLEFWPRLKANYPESDFSGLPGDLAPSPEP